MEHYHLDAPSREEHAQILDIWEASVRATHHFLAPEDIDFFKQTIQEHRLFEQVDMTVARDSEGRIMGFMGLSGEMMEMLFLAPDAIGKGVGALLMRHAIDHKRVRKVDVNEQNESAVRFYQKFGFKETARSPLDGTGKPYPILHLELSKEAE